MNRTNSVEPTFSQPLSMNYHQLLQNKTKIEDELYQTQRQLRKKEGEYKKKIALYEQRVEQMEQQIDEFKEREYATRSMYDKILNTLNQQDKDEFVKPKCQQQDNASKIQIETLEISLQHLNESYNKLKQQYQVKERDWCNIQRDLQQIKESSKDKEEQLLLDLKLLQEEKQQNEQSQQEKEVLLRKQHKEELDRIKMLNHQESEMLQNKISDLENILSQKIKQEQLMALDKSYQKENQEQRHLIDNLKKEKERENEIWIKEREVMQQQLQQQEQLINRIKKQMNNNLQNNNEATKRLKQKLSDAERDLQIKTEEVQKLKNKVSVFKAQSTKQDQLERKQSQLVNTSQISKENLLQKAFETGKEQFINLCETSQYLEQTQNKQHQKTSRGHKNKMFGNDIGNNQIISRNSNCQSQSSLSYKDQQNNFTKSRSQTPNAKQKQKLSKQIQNNVSISQAMHSHRSKKKLDEIQQTKKKELMQYVIYNEQESLEEAITDKSFTPRLNKENQRVFFTSLEIEEVVRRMIDQAKNDKDQLSQSNYSSQNVSFSHKKHKQFEHDNKQQQNNFQKSNCFFVDKQFLSKLEMSLKKLTKSNEKIKQIMKEKEAYQDQCNKLKQKVSFLKEEKLSLQKERDILMVQNQKIECKLKQAQVILNLDGDHQQNNTIYDLTSDVSTIKKKPRLCELRDISPHTQRGLTLNLGQEQLFNSRYGNLPMSCKVNDSCETSIKMSQELHQLGSQSNKNLFHQTLDKSILDQSNITLKRSQHQTSNLNQSLAKFMPNGISTTTMPSQAYQQRGKTPTLQINLAQNQEKQRQWVFQNDSNFEDSSRILCKSTTNLIHKNNQVQKQTEKKSVHNAFQKYSTIRESQTKLFRSPQMNKINTSNFNSTVTGQQRERSPRQMLQSNKTLTPPFQNTQKSQNRYYSRRIHNKENEEDDDCNDIIDIRTVDNQDWETEENMQCRDQDIIQPSDEREGEEQTVQLKLVNNTQFIPSMHARYIGDD